MMMMISLVCNRGNQRKLDRLAGFLSEQQQQPHAKNYNSLFDLGLEIPEKNSNTVGTHPWSLQSTQPQA
jgi:hypothetical protein